MAGDATTGLDYRWTFGRTRLVLCAGALLLAVAGVAGTHGIKRLTLATIVLGLLLTLLWLLRISYRAELSRDAILSFRSPVRRVSTPLDQLTAITAYKGGGRRYLSFKFRFAGGSSRIWGRDAGAFVDEIVARRPGIDVSIKVLPGA
jgi:hypothetical protein